MAVSIPPVDLSPQPAAALPSGLLVFSPSGSALLGLQPQAEGRVWGNTVHPPGNAGDAPSNMPTLCRATERTVMTVDVH